MRRAALLLALAACQPAPRPPPEHRALAAVVRHAWTEAGLPDADARDCDLRSFSVRTPDASGYRRMCATEPSRSAACLVWEADESFFSPTRSPVVVVSPLFRVDPPLILHELLHAAAVCSGFVHGDRLHTEARIWSAAGGADSAQSRALSMM